MKQFAAYYPSVVDWMEAVLNVKLQSICQKEEVGRGVDMIDLALIGFIYLMIIKTLLID